MQVKIEDLKLKVSSLIQAKHKVRATLPASHRSSNPV